MDAAEQERRLVALSVAPESAGLPAGDRAMVNYALKLTRTPAAMGVSDIDELRAAGLNDRAIHDLCSIVSYFAFVNRIADGLGIEMEEPSSES